MHCKGSCVAACWEVTVSCGFSISFLALDEVHCIKIKRNKIKRNTKQSPTAIFSAETIKANIFDMTLDTEDLSCEVSFALLSIIFVLGVSICSFSSSSSCSKGSALRSLYLSLSLSSVLIL